MSYGLLLGRANITPCQPNELLQCVGQLCVNECDKMDEIATKGEALC